LVENKPLIIDNTFSYEARTLNCIDNSIQSSGTNDLNKFLRDIALDMGVRDHIDNKTNEWAFTLSNISVSELKSMILNDNKSWKDKPLPTHVKVVIENKIFPELMNNHTSKEPQILTLKPSIGYINKENEFYILGKDLDALHSIQFFDETKNRTIILSNTFPNSDYTWIKIITPTIRETCTVKLQFKIGNMLTFMDYEQTYEFKDFSKPISNTEENNNNSNFSENNLINVFENDYNFQDKLI